MSILLVALGIACSALKEKYRDILTQNVKDVEWVFLQGSFELIKERLKNRTGHFMPTSLLTSQFQDLEVPPNAFSVNIDQSPENIVQAILNHLTQK